jgi:hypothetical protein
VSGLDAGQTGEHTGLRRRNRLLLAGAIVSLAVIGVFAGITQYRLVGRFSSAVTLRTASAKSLAAAGIVLVPPTSAAKATRRQAIKAILENYPFGAKIVETVLAQVHTIPPSDPPYSRTCWVVSVHPTGGVFGANGERGKWEIALVSAKSGHWLFTTVYG